jgi:peptide deformylase
MTVLPLTYAPHPIFKQKASPIHSFGEETKTLASDMLETLYFEEAVGLGAPMVGILKRIAVVDLKPNGKPKPYAFINPEIIDASPETQSFEEASLCFPYISAPITRPRAIKLRYLDQTGHSQTLEADGFLASVIQHELDYLDGKVFLDYLSPMKRQMLMKKMLKYIKLNPPHIHDEHCHH